MIRKLAAPMVAVATTALLATMYVSCGDNDVGVPCDRDIAPASGVSQSEDVRINPQALTCKSRLCILYSPTARSLCTQPCDTKDDCGGPTETCKGGYECVVGQSVEGGLQCCKLCVCAEFLPGGNDPQEKSCEGRERKCPKI